MKAGLDFEVLSKPIAYLLFVFFLLGQIVSGKSAFQDRSSRTALKI